ncbi:MAG: prepilin-type N-terminal cleavage/methylation domain-containing protein [bacterium]|nr:prepilin-type N-terminal cleavage/methylation domain-containing protein [bacterium]
MLKLAHKRSRGFTLIELLVVLAVLGVIAAGVVTAINPLKRIRQANDAKTKNDVGQISTVSQAYYTTNQVYPADLGALVTSGDLKVLPTPPGGGAYSYAITNPCTTTSCEAQVSFALQDPLVAGNVWCWRSATGVVAEIAAAACTP